VYMQDFCSPLPHLLMESCRRGSRACKLTTGCIKLLKELTFLQFFLSDTKKREIWILSSSKRYIKMAKMRFIACLATQKITF
jgi:hypothetical protein